MTEVEWADNIKQALQVAFECGQIDGGHHKMWVIDQMVRALLGDHYEQWVKDYERKDEDGDEYEWDTGIVP